MVERFVREGGDVNAVPEHYSWTGFRWTMLHWAALFQAEDVVRFLVERGADVTRVNANGETPWDVANNVGVSPETAKLLDPSNARAGHAHAHHAPGLLPPRLSGMMAPTAGGASASSNPDRSNLHPRTSGLT